MKNIFYMWLVVAAVWTSSIYMPKIEGRLFPVIVNTQFITVLADGDTWSTLEGTFDKIRNCSRENVEFRLGTPGFSSYADVAYLEAANISVPGKDQAFGPWRIQLTPDQLLNRSYSTIYHRCHPFWLTETRFYPTLLEDSVRAQGLE